MVISMKGHYTFNYTKALSAEYYLQITDAIPFNTKETGNHI